MRMATAFLLMEDDGARLGFPAEPRLNGVDFLPERMLRNVSQGGGAQRQREQILAALRAATDRLRFLEGPAQIIARETAQLRNLHMLVVIEPGQMLGQVLAAARAGSL